MLPSEPKYMVRFMPVNLFDHLKNWFVLRVEAARGGFKQITGAPLVPDDRQDGRLRILLFCSRQMWTLFYCYLFHIHWIFKALRPSAKSRSSTCMGVGGASRATHQSAGLVPPHLPSSVLHLRGAALPVFSLPPNPPTPRLTSRSLFQSQTMTSEYTSLSCLHLRVYLMVMKKASDTRGVVR